MSETLDKDGAASSGGPRALTQALSNWRLEDSYAVPRGRLVIACTFLVNFMVSLDVAGIEVILPRLVAVLGADLGLGTWILSGYLVAMNAFLLIFGALADSWSRKGVYLLGILLFGLSSVGCAMSDGIWTLIAFRVIQGGAAAMISAAGSAFIVLCLPEERRSRAFGYIGSAIALGYLAGPTIGSALFELVSWQSIFLINVPLCAVLAIGAWSILPLTDPGDEERPRSAGFDLVGAISLLGSVSCLTLLIDGLREHGILSPPSLIIAAVLAVSAAGLAWSNRRRDDPIVDFYLFAQNMPFVLANAASFWSFVGAYLIAYVAPFFVLNSLGLTLTEMGLLLTTFPMGFVIGAPTGGWLASRFPVERVLLAAQLVVAASGLLMAGLDERSGIVEVGLVTFLVGYGRGLFIAPFNTCAMGCLPVYKLGVGAGLIALIRNLGMMVGTAIAGALLAGLAGGQPWLAGQREGEAMVRFMDAAHLILSLSAGAAGIAAVFAAVLLFHPKNRYQW